jgi:hypothetical protein
LKTAGVHNVVDRSLASAGGDAVGWAAGIAAAYFVAALLGLALRAQPSDVAGLARGRCRAGIGWSQEARIFSAHYRVVVGKVAANLLSDGNL